MTETTKATLQVITAGAALVGALTGIYNTVQLSRVQGLVDGNQAAINAHVNAAAIHGR